MADDLILVVEGRNDKHVMWAIVAHHRFTPEFSVKDEGGIETLLDQLPIRLKIRDLKRIGIVVDADIDVAARWGKLKRILADAGYAGLPDNPDPAGTVVHQDSLPRVGIWLMPDNVLPGMLEDYVALLVPQGDALWDRARHCLDEVPLAERRFSEHHHSKALIHTWLAWQDDPGTPLGQAITKKYFDPGSLHVTKFLAWLTRVFA